MSTRYYSSSAPFRWLRKNLKLDKPYALPLGEWSNWEAEAKSSRPVAYWLTEILPAWLEKPAEWLVDPVSDSKYYLRNRFITQPHKLKTGLKPGTWHELDTRLLHGLFTELVNFVEIEKAHTQVIWAKPEVGKKYHLPWWRRIHWFRWDTWRSVEAGLDYLRWEITLVKEADWFDSDQHPDIGTPSDQALAAQEILDLYTWWKQTRPARPDEYDASGWTAYCDQVRERYGNLFEEEKTAAEREQSKLAMDKLRQLENQYNQEDTDMLIRLIRIRQCLWT